jgi:hypothetical protein
MEIPSSSSLGYIFDSWWIKVGENASPMTDQNCMIRHLYFAVVPQDGGYPLSFPLSSFVTSLTPASLCLHEDVIHGIEGYVRLVHMFPPNITHIVGQ